MPPLPLAAAQSKIALTGHVAPQVRSAARLARVSADERVSLSLVVRLDQGLLDQTLEQIYGPRAPAKRNFLTPAEFARRFGLAEKRQALKDFARANGLEIDPSEDRPQSLVVKVAGPAASVEKAFGVELNRYRLPDGRSFRAHESEPTIPESLIPHLGVVMGLSNVPGLVRPHLRFPSKPASSGGARPSTAAAGRVLGGMTGPGPGLSPADIKTIYGFSGPWTGAGQTLAIVELDGFDPADIALYQTQFGLASPPLSFVSVDGAPNLCGASQNQPCNAATLASDGSMVEVALDIELAAAMAPGSSLMMIYTSFNTLQGLVDIYSKIASDDLAEVVSTSWGLDESDTGSAIMTAENTVFAQLAAQGQSVFAAAGDNGAFDQGGQTTLVVDDPAGQPFVTAVGGTSLSGTVASPTETVWNNGFDVPSGKFVGGGGGLSGQWTLPSYQTGVAGMASHQFRNVPDVALDADPNSSPYSICVGGSCTTVVGGTSAAAPLWAGLTALINQQRWAASNGSLGFGNPSFYSLAGGPSYGTVFKDITAGDNGFYAAAAGYDDATGWGSFKADAMIAALANLNVTPGPPPPAAVQFSFVSTDTVTASWTLVGGSTYTMVLAASADFSSIVSSATGLLNQNATSYFGLTQGASYYFQVKITTNPDSAYSAAISTVLPVVPPPPAPANVQFTSVSSSSLSIGWTLVSGNSYLMVLSTNSNFSSTISSAVGALNQHVVTYAVAPAFYYFKVKISTDSDRSYSAPIATAAANLAGSGTSATASPSAPLVLSLVPVSGPITLTFPAGACGPFPNAVTASIPTIAPGPSSGPGGSITPLGPMVEITLAQPLAQFLQPVSVQMAFNPPPYNASLIKLAWYDWTTAQWWPEVDAVYDPVGKVLNGTIRHNSLHAAVAVQAAADLTHVKVFPNPVNFGTAVRGTVKFMGLSLQSTITIYSLSGEQVMTIAPRTFAGATVNDGISGAAEWDGRNSLGSAVARGTYLFVIKDPSGHAKRGKIGVVR
ncbi:MAG: S8/S53 family peptidase [Elusimicrobia bacterium]|nr:S8/S53 family peptidase [Elusimicrobiota bacterium]